MNNQDYNYYTTPTTEQYQTLPPPSKKNTGKKVARTVSLLLAVALVGTAGGFGGSMLHAELNPVEATSNVAATDDIGVLNTADTSKQSLNLSVSEIAQKAQPSVVEITTEVVVYGTFNQSYVGSGAGSGVIVSEDGYIVTNHHVIDDASSITVKTVDGESYEATLVGSDAETDLAVLKVEASGLTAATIGSSGDLAVGDYVMAIGNPLGHLGGSVSDGIISALSREITIEGETMTLLQTNAAVNPGNSGGGLFNENGELVGVVNAKSSSVEVEGIGFAIPIDIAVEVMEDIIEVGYVQGRFTLGVSVLEVDSEEMAAMYRLDELGLYIQSITQGGNAHLAGMQAGDRIVEFDGQEIMNFEDLQSALEQSEANSTVEVIIQRAGETQVMRVVLNETVANTIETAIG